MALAAGPKSNKNLKRLPYAREPVPWIEHATGRTLYPWQKEILRELTKPTRPRVFYGQVARKNGKTFLAACLVLAEICLKKQRHVYAISDSEKNLDTVLMQELRDLILGSSLLCDSLHIRSDGIECPETGSWLRVRTNVVGSTNGISPHLVIADEVHELSPKVLDGMQQAGRARRDALMFAISTPGYDLTCRAHEYYQQVKAGALAGKIYEGDPALPLDDRKNWRAANPCYDYMPWFADALEYDRKTLPEHEFRRFALGCWTATDAAWLPYGAWDARDKQAVFEKQGITAPWYDEPPEGTKVWLGFDGSHSGDSTALVGCTHEGHLFIAGLWENPGKEGWRVPRDDVMDTVATAFDWWDVQELVGDPPFWLREMAEWSAAYPGRVHPFPTNSAARMAPAVSSFYAAVMDERLTHSGDKRLARHIANATVRSDRKYGDVIEKPTKDSPAKIDLAIAAVLAHARASISVPKPEQPTFVLWG